MTPPSRDSLAPPARPVRWLPSAHTTHLLLECAAALLLILEAAGLLAFGHALSRTLLVTLWVQWFVVLVVLRLAGLFQLFGPVFFYDLIRMTRRGRYFLVRTLYAGALLLLLLIVWENHFAYRGDYIARDQMAEFAASFFTTFMSAQFGVVLLLTPAYVAGAIAEEKERRTMEFILATDLRNREIVLGKLASRLVNLTFLVIAGLPILAILQFLGGIDPGLVLAGFAATAVTMFSLAAVSILCSVLVRKPRDAIVLAYLSILAYYLLVSLPLLLLTLPGWDSSPSTSIGTSSITLRDVLEWLNAGNIFYLLAEVSSVAGSKPLETVLPPLLGRYALFHGLAALVCCVLAVVRVRSRALNESTPAKRAKGAALQPVRRVPPVSVPPMVWKERYAERGLRLHWLGNVFLAIIVGASFLPVLLIVVIGGHGARDVYWQFNVWVRLVGTAVACLLLLAVAVRAATSITGERDRQTLDGLLTTPLTTQDILYGKWVGSVLTVRWGWLWLGAIYGLGLLTCGVNVIAVPLVLVTWFAYAGFVAALGLWFSTICQSSLRAVVWTVFSILGLWGGHWLIWMCCVPIMMMSRGMNGRGSEDVFLTLVLFQTFSLTPPLGLGFLAFQGEEFTRSGFDNHHWFFVALFCALFGMVVWGGMGIAIWNATVQRFSALMGRTPYKPYLGIDGRLRRELPPRSPEARR
jgi:ABC-type transport system involved in multi-copper enzyme maturation permease subunit